ncbi:MAG: undecaprenyl-phosphate alpha-N-acetylglucosaminyl 1-phosphate transferase [Phycisphaeraceae bacterium]|nr:MAG: undecaprenyl-phosphate alpha-N-acetylglucosaminyl 1-phosphate transferase [Phycisphaeraceae bacterium]
MVWICLTLIGVGFAIACPACWGAMRLGRRMGAHGDAMAPGQVKDTPRSIPNTGGVGIYLAIAVPLLAGLALAWALDSGTLALPGFLEPAAVHLPGVLERAPLALAFLGAITLLHVMGLIDDRRPMGPWAKLAIMVAPALLVAWPTPALDTRLLTMLDAPAGGQWASVALTVLWIVAITNAMNFIDNMDGLCASVAAIAAACFLGAALINEQWFVAAVLALVVGASAGFLVWNMPPARLFMGDSGSLVLGFTLAFLTVRATYVGDAGTAGSGAWYGVFMPVLVLAIPLYDFTSVTLVRLSQGKSPFVGDMQHLSHRLVKRGLSKRAAVAVIAGFALVIGLGGISLGSLEPWQAILVVVQTVVMLAVVAVFEWRSSPGSGAP